MYCGIINDRVQKGWIIPMKIEKVTEEDAKELLKIYEPYVTDTAISFEYEVPTLEEFKNRIEEISSKYPYIKAVEDGRIIGYAYANTFKGRQAYDWSVETTIYIAKEARRNGAGRQLYEQLEKSLKSMGILNMNACIAWAKEDDEHLNNDSYYFHGKMGFNMVGTFHDSGYKFNRWYDMIWMEKMIGEHTPDASNVNFGEWSL